MKSPNLFFCFFGFFVLSRNGVTKTGWRLYSSLSENWERVWPVFSSHGIQEFVEVLLYFSVQSLFNNPDRFQFIVLGFYLISISIFANVPGQYNIETVHKFRHNFDALKRFDYVCCANRQRFQRMFFSYVWFANGNPQIRQLQMWLFRSFGGIVLVSSGLTFSVVTSGTPVLSLELRCFQTSLFHH